MAHCGQSPQDNKYMMVLLGRKWRLKEVMVKGIVSSEDLQCSVGTSSVGTSSVGTSSVGTSSVRACSVVENREFRVVIVPDDFDDKNLSFDHNVIDLMAMSLPGPHLFILAIDQENAEASRIQEQIQLLQKTFGEDVVLRLVITLPDIETFQTFKYLKESLHIFTLAIANENLAQMCRDWCQGQERFNFHYSSYSREVVQRRRLLLSHCRCMGLPLPDLFGPPPVERPPVLRGPPQTQHQHPEAVETSIVFLGLTGTGKSASVNTLLAAAKSKTRFESMSNSKPVTRECQSESVELGGARLRLVDTPDLFQEDSQQAVEKVKSYLALGPFVVMLVVKVNRVTDQERHILQKLEQRLGLRVQEQVVLLLTCAEELKGKPLNDFVNANKDLTAIAKLCEYRIVAFKNKKKSSKQVQRLLTYLKVMGVAFPKRLLLPDVTL